MAQTAEERNSVHEAVEDVHNTLVAASKKLAQVQMDVDEDDDLGTVASDLMNKLGPMIDQITAVGESYQMETNRLANEGELAD